MVICERCGKQNTEDAVYCSSCGAWLERVADSHYHVASDYLGGISAGVVLIALAVTYFMYPFDFHLISNYLGNMIALQRYIKPPVSLLVTASFFFNVVGAWSVVLAGLRLTIQKSIRRSIGDLAGAAFDFFLAFLLYSYAENVLTTANVFEYFLVGAISLVVVNIVSQFLVRHERSHIGLRYLSAMVS